MITDSIVMWETRLSIVDWGLFQDSDFAGDLEDSKSTSARILCIFRSRTFVPTTWMCKKQTLDLWDVVIEVLHSSKNTHQAMRDHSRTRKVDDQVPRSRARSEIRSTNSNTKSKRNSNPEVDELSDVDHVVTSAKLSHFEAQLYIFEDNE